MPSVRTDIILSGFLDIGVRCFVRGVKKCAEKLFSHIPDLYPDIEVVKLKVQVDHIHVMVVIPPRYAVARVVCSISNHGLQGSLRQGFLFWGKSIFSVETPVLWLLCIVHRF